MDIGRLDKTLNPSAQQDTGNAGIQERTLSQKLVGNVLANFVGQFSTLLIAFAVVPYVVHRVGADLYGLLIIVAILGGLGGFSLGFGTTLAKFISEPSSSNDPASITQLLQTAVTFCGAIGILCCLVFFIERKGIASLLFHGNKIAAPVVSLAICVAACCILISLISDALSGILIGLQRFDLYNRIRIATSLVRNIGSVVVLAFGLYIEALIVVYLLAALVSFVAYLRYGYNLVPGLRLRPKLVWVHFQRLAAFAIPVVMVGLGTLAVVRGDRILIAYFLPLSAVAFYTIPYMLTEKMGVAVSNITSAIFPLTSELSSLREQDRVRELYLRGTKMVVLLALPLSITLFVFSGPILRWWVGPEYALKGSVALALLSLGYLANVCAYVPSTVAQGLGVPWIAAKYSLLNGAVNLFFFVLLIPRFGINGAAAAYLVSELIVTPLLVRKVNLSIGVGWKSLIARSYLRPAICGSIAFLVLWAVRGYVGSFRSLVLFCGIGLVTYALPTLAIGIDKQERNGILVHVLQSTKSFRGALGA